MLSTLILFLAGFFVFVAPMLFRRWLRRYRKAPEANRCRCGYSMDQLDTIRCPECGRVSGFNATAEELELTTEQLLRAKAKRDARERAGLS